MTRHEFWALCAAHVPRYEYADSREKWNEWLSSKTQIDMARDDFVHDYQDWMDYWNGEGPRPEDPDPPPLAA